MKKTIIVIVIILLIVLGSLLFYRFKFASNNESSNSETQQTHMENQQGENVQSEPNIQESNQETISENIASVSRDERANPYVKLSDNYYFDDFKPLEKREIKPSKIYLVDTNNTIHLDGNGQDVTLTIPIEKCEDADDERIVYSDYGIEKILNAGIIKVGGIELEQFTYDSEYDGTSHKEDIIRLLDSLNIYEVELDNNESTKELLVECYFSHPWDSNIYPYLIKLEDDVATNMGIIENENIMQLGKYSNVFTDGWNSDVEQYFSNILMGYYIYDREYGLLHANKMADGDDIENISLDKLTECILKEEMTFGPATEETTLYSDKISYSLTGYQEDSGHKTLSQGTVIKVVEIVDGYGNFIGETEDGTRYGFFSYAGRT